MRALPWLMLVGLDGGTSTTCFPFADCIPKQNTGEQLILSTNIMIIDVQGEGKTGMAQGSVYLRTVVTAISKHSHVQIRGILLGLWLVSRADFQHLNSCESCVKSLVLFLFVCSFSDKAFLNSPSRERTSVSSNTSMVYHGVRPPH